MPFSLLNEHACTPLCRLSPCCCSLTSYASFPSLRWSLFTSQFAQNGQWRKRVLHSLISVFTTSRLLFSGCLYSAPLYTKCESVDLEVRFWDITSYEKNKEIKALTFTTKHGSWSGSKNNNGKKNKRKNCLIRALGKKWLTPMHTPAFCQADRRHDNHFFSPNTQWAILVEMFVWKDRASRRWDRSNRRATIFGTVNCCLQKYLKK